MCEINRYCVNKSSTKDATQVTCDAVTPAQRISGPRLTTFVMQMCVDSHRCVVIARCQPILATSHTYIECCPLLNDAKMSILHNQHDYDRQINICILYPIIGQ